MKRVDRLTIRIKRAYGQFDKQLSLALIDFMKEGEYKGKWRARADLWDGKDGSEKPEDTIYSYHDSIDEAINAIEAVAEVHAPIGNYKVLFEDIPIIINDIME